MNRAARRLLKSARKRRSDGLSGRALATVDSMMHAAAALHRDGAIDAALRGYGEILELYPDHPDALSNRGLISVQTGAVAEGLDSLRAAVAKAPDNAKAHNNLGYALESVGALEEAEPALRRALEIDPGLADGHINLGNVLKKAGRFEEAVESYRHALSLSPGHAIVHNNMGNALMLLGRTDDAMEQLRTAVEIDPNLAEAVNNIGIVHQDRGDLDHAVAAFRDAVAIDPLLANAHYNLGCALTEAGDSEGAMHAFRDCLEANPHHANACLNLSKLLLDEGRLREAVPTLRKAAEQCPSNPAVLGILANLLADGDGLDEALSFALDALRADPHSSYALCGLAKTLIEMGRHADASAIYADLPPPRTEHDVAALGWLCDGLRRHQRSHDGARVLDHLLENAPLTPQQRHGRLVDKAVDAWLAGDTAGCRAAAAAAAELSGEIGARAVDRHALVFERYVLALLDYRERHPELYPAGACDELHVIGESHCMAPHGTTVEIGGVPFRMSGHMILGCKAWHLADPTPNYFQRAFRAIAGGLWDEANVLVAFGEIDCRPNEGIYPLHKKKGVEAAELIDATVTGFVDFVVGAAAERNLHVNFCGVPAPHRERFARLPLPAEETAAYVGVIARFNAALERAASDRGLGFVDLYGMSAGDDGIADGRFHIDDTHLLPAALHQAIANS